MNEEKKDVIETAIEKVPKELLAFLVSEDLSKKIHFLYEKYGIKDSFQNMVSEDVSKILLGIEGDDSHLEEKMIAAGHKKEEVESFLESLDQEVFEKARQIVGLSDGGPDKPVIIEQEKKPVLVDWQEKFNKIVSDYKLGDEISSELRKVVSLVLEGNLPVFSFISEISKIKNLDKEQASRVAAAIDSEIFDNVRETLENIHTEKEIASGKDESVGGVEIQKHFSPDIESASKDIAPIENREEIMEGIENPKFSQTTTARINPVQNVVSPKTPEKTIEKVPEKTAITVAEPTEIEIRPKEPSDLTSQKLSGITKAPPRYPSADPYREPIN